MTTETIKTITMSVSVALVIGFFILVTISLVKGGDR